MALVKFPVQNRWNGEIQFTAEIEVKDWMTPSYKLGLAVKWGVQEKANLRSADLGGANLRSANLRSADLGGANLRSADLGGADLRSADLGGANLGGADLGGADLGGADLGGANLGGADLGGADLRSADLGGANLRSADLGGADLGGALIFGEPIKRFIAAVSRLDGYIFFGFIMETGETKIRAGCRWFSLSAFRDHVSREYPDTPKAQETTAILDFIEVRASQITNV